MPNIYCCEWLGNLAGFFEFAKPSAFLSCDGQSRSVKIMNLTRIEPASPLIEDVDAQPMRGQKSLGPFEKPLEIADYVFCPHKKITSRTNRISGTLTFNF
jgi:hypothetical protein